MPDSPNSDSIPTAQPVPPSEATYVQGSPPLLTHLLAIKPMAIFAPPEHPDEIGKLGRYRVLQELGKGGMGIVYLGFDAGLERKIALKIMLPEFAVEPSSRERFLHEARSAAKVKSDHVVTVFDVGEEQGVPFMAMQYLQGSPLDRHLEKKGNVSVEQAVRIGRETAIGLAAAHELGLIHRDIKPANIWLESPRGRVKILDFGLARQEKDDIHLTKSGTVVGTPAYMSPEQARGDKTDARSDLFSLGAVLYRLTTGQLPFRGDTTMAILTSLAIDDPIPVRQYNTDVSEPFAAVIHKLLAKKPDQRFQTAREVVTALSQLGKATATGANPIAPKVEPLEIQPQTENVWTGIDDEKTETIERTPNAPLRPLIAPKQGRGLTWLAVGTVALFALVLLFFVLGRSPKGFLRVESDDENAELVVKKDGKVIRDRTLAREIELPVGNYTLELAEKRDGLKLGSETVSITRDGTETVRVRLEKPKSIPKPKEVIATKDPDRKVAEWALSLKANLRFENHQPDVTDPSLLPRGPLRLVRIIVPNRPEFREADLAMLKECKSLTSIWLNRCPVTDVGLGYVLECKELKELHLEGSLVSDAGLALLKDRDHLERLNLSETKVTGNGLIHLKGCRNLRALWLGKLPLSDSGLAALSELDRLNILFLNEVKIGDAGLAAIGKLRNLVQLHLEGCQIADTGLPHLERLKRLDLLKLHRNPISDPAIAKLREALPHCRIEWDRGEYLPQPLSASARLLPIHGWVSLLPAVDVQRDHLGGVGEWVRFGEEIESVGGRGAGGTVRLRLPVLVEGDFDLEVIATRKTGGRFAIDFPVGGTGGSVGFPVRGRGGLEYIDGKSASDGMTAKDWTTEPDRRYRILTSVRVENEVATISVTVDDQPFAAWSGKTNRLKCLSGMWAKGIIDIGTTADATIRFHDVRLRLVRGEAKPTHPEDARMLSVGFDLGADPERRIAEYLLALGGKVEVNQNAMPIDKASGLPGGRISLTAINLSNKAAINDADLAVLKHAKNLQRVHFASTSIGDATLFHLRDLPLTWIDIYRTDVTDVGLAAMKGKNFTYLNLGSLKISDKGLAHLASSTDLQVISLNGVPITDEGLAHFKNCPGLGYLDLCDTKVGDAGMEHLKASTKLRTVNLSGTKVTNQGFAAFKDCTLMEDVDLNHTAVTDEVMVYFPKMPRLKWLKVSHTKVTREAGEKLWNLMPQTRITLNAGTFEPKK